MKMHKLSTQYIIMLLSKSTGIDIFDHYNNIHSTYNSHLVYFWNIIFSNFESNLYTVYKLGKYWKIIKVNKITHNTTNQKIIWKSF